MPTEIAERQARTRGYNATADATEVSVAQEREWQRLVRKGAGGDPAAAQQVMSAAGQDVNVTANRGPAAQLYQWADMAARAGMTTRATEFLTKASTIDSHQATAASAQATALRTRNEDIQKRFAVIGGLAQTALDKPELYSLLRIQAQSMGLAADQLPATFEEAKPRLEALVARSLSAKEQLELQMKTTEEAAKKTRRETQNKRDNAAIGLMGARSKLTNERYERLKKTLGPDHPESVAARRAALENKEAHTAALNVKLYPPAPTDPKLRIPSQVYTLPIGRLQWTKDGWVEAPKAARELSAARAAQDTDFSDLDEDDE